MSRSVRARRESVESLLRTVRAQANVFEGFGSSVEAILLKNPEVSDVVHSAKRRAKSDASLAKKIEMKRAEGCQITSDNIFKEITDIYAVRLIHLYPQDISVIHRAIEHHAQAKDWVFAEKPKAYTWDPESKDFLQGLGLKCSIKPSYYTSVHYLLRPRKDAVATCELQVRSLLEEVWGEADHKAKYKKGIQDPRVDEHLAVLARLVGAGSRLMSALRVDGKPGSESTF
ncbi:hypothetical protein [Thermomonas sp. LB-4]|uniref:hypothetical protein n=1 Tax=Thermomonas sp. LB-4 TaxID=3102790 RepID=UPI002EDB9EBC